MSHMVTNSNLTGTNLVLFQFRLKWFGMNETRQNIPESELCLCFLFGIRIGMALISCVSFLFHLCWSLLLSVALFCGMYLSFHVWKPLSLLVALLSCVYVSFPVCTSLFLCARHFYCVHVSFPVCPFLFTYRILSFFPFLPLIPCV